MKIDFEVARTGTRAAAPARAPARRTRAERVLANPTRRAAFEFVTTAPGVTCADVARAVGVDYSTASHHIRTLVHHHYLAALRAQAGFRYFENHGRFRRDAQRRLAVLAQPRNRRLFDAIAGAPGVGVSALARRLGLAKSTVSRRAGILREAGLVVADGRGLVAATVG